MSKKKTYAAIVLAAGSGKRMGSKIKKQYMEINGRELIYYPLRVFEESPVDEVILVVSPGDEDYVRERIVDTYGFSKVKAVVPGGEERYLSVWEGIKKVSAEYVLVHDGARCCLTQEIVAKAMVAAVDYEAAVIAVPSVDTVKIADESGYVKETPVRARVWSIQTPQAFQTGLLRNAYEKLFGKAGTDGFTGITDDAMIVETAFPEQKIKLVMGDYNNIKVTTAKDISVAEEVLSAF